MLMKCLILSLFRSEEEALSQRSVIIFESLEAGLGGARVTGCYTVKIALNRTQAFFPGVSRLHTFLASCASRVLSHPAARCLSLSNPLQHLPRHERHRII